MSLKPLVKPFLDKESNTYTYLVSCPESKASVIIDSVLDFDLPSATTSTSSCDALLNHVQEHALDVLFITHHQVKYIVDTHSHADHLSGSAYLKSRIPGATNGISQFVTKTQAAFKDILGLDFPHDGYANTKLMIRSQFDHLLKEGDSLPFGKLNLSVLYTPGHTIDSCAYVIGDAVFVGDTLFKEDSGTARCDFPNGDAHLLWDSIHKILSLPSDTRVFLCHDYGAGGKRDLECETTVQDQLVSNIHVKKGTEKETYVKMRDERDAKLSLPRLLLPSIQFNIQGGLNVKYLKLVLNQADKYSRNYQ